MILQPKTPITNLHGRLTINNFPTNRETVAEILDHTLTWSKSEKYRGWNKHDGLNSPILRTFLGWGKWPRIVAIQAVMRFPFNLRPFLLIPKVYNPKGLALFALSWLDRYQLEGNEVFLREAEYLLQLLIQIQSPGHWNGTCWGYHYPWRDVGFFAPTNSPNAVVTAFVSEAFLEAYRITGNRYYLDVVGSTVDFFLQDLFSIKNDSEELCLSYVPIPITMRVIDVSILVASVIAQYQSLTNEQDKLNAMPRLVDYVVRRQTNEGAWFYTDPPHHSHIRHDNYHTGFILDALWRIITVIKHKNHCWESAYWKGIDFYAKRLFNHDGSPRWMADTDYPHDIHGSAQGILTFARHYDQYPGFASKIVNWATANMYHQEGRFFYQQTPHLKKSFTLLRWCNAWMAHALARWLLASPR